MNKIRYLTPFLLAGALLAAPLFIQAQETPVTALEGIDWVRSSVEKYPEISWLANANVRKTEEGQPLAEEPYSQQLFGQTFIEFDRTLMTLHCLQLILDGSEKAYGDFTKAQGVQVKLSKESFDKLHAEGVKLLQSKVGGLSEIEMRQAMEAALVLGDMGKSEKAREIFKPYGATAPDHDDFHGEAMKILVDHPELCPTFAKLPAAARKLLSETANLAHYGHMTHIEGGPNMFTKLKQSGVAASPTALSFDWFIHLCDVAGALGHVNKHSSLVYTEQAHQAMQGVAEACKVLADPAKTEQDAYDHYLNLRAGWLGLDGTERIDRALTRMGAMLRLFKPEEGRLLKEAVLKLGNEEREKIIAQLDSPENGRTPTYMPAVLVNLANNPKLGSTKEEKLEQAVIKGLPFLSRVLEQHKQMLANGKANPQIPLNFNKAAGIAKTDAEQLNQDWEIDPEGNVYPTGTKS